MSQLKAEVKQIEGLQLVGRTGSGFATVLDTSVEAGGLQQGPTPKEMLLVALAGCTAMDVISILQKMKEPLENLTVKVEAETNDTPQVRKEDHHHLCGQGERK